MTETGISQAPAAPVAPVAPLAGDAAEPAEPDQAARSFLEKAGHLLETLLEVRVITGVGDLGVSLASDDRVTKVTLDDSQHKVTQSIVTIVNLGDGDTTTIIAPGLIDNADLRALHAAQVKESLEVLPRNLKALVHLAGEIVGAIKKL